MITAERAMTTLDEIIRDTDAENKTYHDIVGTNEWCQYVSDSGEPLCIVGRVFARLNPELNETILARGGNEWALDVLYRDGIISGEVSKNANEVLAVAQVAQDTGKTWGEARDAARAVYETLLS